MIAFSDVERARHGDRAAYLELVRATQNLVSSITLSLVSDVSVSEELAQEVYLGVAWVEEAAQQRELSAVAAAACAQQGALVHAHALPVASNDGRRCGVGFGGRCWA